MTKLFSLDLYRIPAFEFCVLVKYRFGRCFLYSAAMQNAFVTGCKPIAVPKAITLPSRSGRKSVVVHAKATSYVPPSLRTGATELDALERYSEVSMPLGG